MAESQVTHDGITKEQKEAIIEEYLKEHGLHIDDAPKVEYKEAYTIMDCVRTTPEYMYRKSGSKGTEPSENSPKENRIVYSEDKFNEVKKLKNTNYTAPSSNGASYRITSYDCSISSSHIDGVSPSRKLGDQGLVTGVEKKISYIFRIMRIDGMYDIEVSVGDMVNVLSFDGIKFIMAKGKVRYFNAYSPVSKHDEMIADIIGMTVDTSASFTSSSEDVFSNTIVDIRPIDYEYDLTIYGTDIKAVYNDWVEENIDALAGTVNGVRVVTPIGDGVFEKRVPIIKGIITQHNFTLLPVQIFIKEQYGCKLLDGSYAYFDKYGLYALDICVIGLNPIVGYIRDDNFYPIPYNALQKHTPVTVLEPHIICAAYNFISFNDNEPEYNYETLEKLLGGGKLAPITIPNFPLQFEFNYNNTDTIFHKYGTSYTVFRDREGIIYINVSNPDKVVRYWICRAPGWFSYIASLFIS